MGYLDPTLTSSRSSSSPNPSPRPRSSARSRAPQVASRAPQIAPCARCRCSRRHRRRWGARQRLRAARRPRWNHNPSRSHGACGQRNSGKTTTRRRARATRQPWAPPWTPAPPYKARSSSRLSWRRLRYKVDQWTGAATPAALRLCSGCRARVCGRGGLAAYMMARYLPNRAALCGGQAARRRPAASHQTTLYFAV